MPFGYRVPLHPEDADRFEGSLRDAEDMADRIRAAETDRLGRLASAKTYLERRLRASGVEDIDSQKTYDIAAKAAGPSPMRGMGAANLLQWHNTQPRSRNPVLHALLIPENAILQGMEALSGDKPLLERADRMARAIPGALYPPWGYPVEPARETMYEELGTIGGLGADLLMPGPGEVADVFKALRPGIPTQLVDVNGNVIRELVNSRPVRPGGGNAR